MAGHLQLADGRTINVHDGMILGRVKACDVQIDDTKASRSHARIIVERGVVEIEDLDSSNGTLLNGNPVARRMLREGDTIRVGNTEIVYRDRPAAVDPARVEPRAAGAQAVEAPSADDDIFSAGDDLLGGGDLLGGDDLLQDEDRLARTDPVGGAVEDRSGGDPLGDGDLLGNDLLGEDLLDDDFVDAPIAAPTQPAPRSPAPPPPAAAPAAPAARSPAPPPPARPKPAPKVAKIPSVEPVRRASHAPAAAAPSVGAAAVEEGDTSGNRSTHGVLQFSQNKRGGGAFRDDIGQTGGAQKALIVLGVLVVALGIGYGVFLVVSQ